MARTFDGVDDQVAVTRTAALEPAQVTCAMWIKSASRDGNFRYWLDKVNVNDDHASYGFQTAGAGVEARFNVSTGAGVRVDADTAATVHDDTWRHLAGSYDLANVRLYLDGTQQAATPETGAIAYNTGKNVYVGSFDNNSLPLAKSGRIAEVGLWSAALTADEVAALAKGTPPSRVRPDKLVLYLPLWGLASPESDLSGNQHNGTVTGATAADHAPAGPYALAPGDGASHVSVAGAQSVSPSGIASAEAFGAVTVTSGPVTVSPSAVTSVEAFGVPVLSVGPVTVSTAAITSGEAFGTPVVAPVPVTVSPSGIATGEALGTPAVSLGSATVSPAGITSGEAFGTPSVIGPVSVSPSGITSSEAFGTPVVTGGTDSFTTPRLSEGSTPRLQEV